MANLVGSDIGLNYKGILNLGATVNQNVSGSLQYLTDGDGNNLPIQVSTTATQLNYGVGIGGVPTTSGLHVYGQAGTTGLVFGGAAATMYIDLNGTGLNFFDATQTRYRNFAGTTLAMNVWGSLGMVAIGGSAASPYTPSALLQVRGDGTNPMFRVETSAGNAILSVNATGNNLTFSGASVTATSATNTVFSLTSTFAAAAGSANYRPLSIAYTINNSGTQTGNTTGIFLNATVTSLGAMTHNLMDLQLGGSSRFSIDTTGMISNIGGWFDNSGFTSRLYQNILQLYNGNNFVGFMGGGGFGINTRLFVGSTAVTPVARLTVRGDGTNTIGRFEHSDGTAALLVTHTPSGIGLQTSGSWVAYNNSSTQLVGIQGGIFAVYNISSTRFQINLTTNEVTLSGRLLGSASTTARASMNIPSGVAPTSPVDGDIWFDGTNIFMRIGGVTKTFTLTP